MLRLFKEPNTGHYVQSTICWQRVCSVSLKPEDQGLYNMFVHSIQTQCIRCIAHLHAPIWGLVKNYNVYLNLLHHGVSRADRKMAILGIELQHMTFSLMFVAHILFIRHDNHAWSNFVYWLVFFPYHDPSLHVYVLGLIF